MKNSNLADLLNRAIAALEDPVSEATKLNELIKDLTVAAKKFGDAEAEEELNFGEDEEFEQEEPEPSGKPLPNRWLEGK